MSKSDLLYIKSPIDHQNSIPIVSRRKRSQLHQAIHQRCPVNRLFVDTRNRQYPEHSIDIRARYSRLHQGNMRESQGIEGTGK
jgi:hypothetical protein